jgi:hypothetical protein
VCFVVSVVFRLNEHPINAHLLSAWTAPSLAVRHKLSTAQLSFTPSRTFLVSPAEWPYVADVRVTFYSLLLSGYARHTIGADNFGRYLNYTLINTLLYIFQSTCRSLRMRRENPSLGFREPRVQRALYPIRKGALQTARRGGRARSRGSAPHGSERWRPTKGMGA